jgi:hypothetical protein
MTENNKGKILTFPGANEGSSASGSGQGSEPQQPGEPPRDLRDEAEKQEAVRRLLEVKLEDERGQKDIALAIAFNISLDTFRTRPKIAQNFFMAAAGAAIRMDLLDYLMRDAQNDVSGVTDVDRMFCLEALSYDNPVTQELITFINDHRFLKPVVEKAVARVTKSS